MRVVEVFMAFNADGYDVENY